MSFFDDKQEILDLQLTTYGRFLISRGKFKPVYYAFFDDSVLYDGQYGELQEQQNEIETRIFDETITLKPQTTFTSIEENVKLNSLLSREIGKLKTEESQISADRNYALSLPLAKSSYVSNYAPAWSLNMISGAIDNIQYILDNSEGQLEILQPYLKYPQINLTDYVFNITQKKNNSVSDVGYNPIFSYVSSSDIYTYYMNDQELIIDLMEQNVDNLTKNYDIEIFIEEDKEIPNSNKNKKVLTKLNFKKETIEILNGILLDEPMSFETNIDSTFVEYYFELTADEEIELPPKQITNVVTYRAAGRPVAPPYGRDC